MPHPLNYSRFDHLNACLLSGENHEDLH
jgi:hypothetical protein